MGNDAIVETPSSSDLAPPAPYRFSPPSRNQQSLTGTHCDFDDSFCQYSDEENEMFFALARSVLDDDDESFSISQFSSSHSSPTPSLKRQLSALRNLNTLQKTHDDDDESGEVASFSSSSSLPPPSSSSSSWLSEFKESLQVLQGMRPFSRDWRRVLFCSVTVHEFSMEQAVSTESSCTTMSLRRYAQQKNQKTNLRSEVCTLDQFDGRAILSKRKVSQEPPPLPIRSDSDETLQRQTERIPCAA
jgi:hypothetical protein